MKRKIVVIEDDEQSLYLTTFILEQNGYEVIQARNGKDGIEAVRGEQPILVLLDIQLPGMSGYEVIQSLREGADTGHIPLVAVTSFAMPGDREGILAAGCRGYVEKPINPETFMWEVEEYFADRPQGDDDL
jgi:two-component system cell cycle response regulator DivK